MNKDIMKSMGFGKQVEAVDHSFCPMCKEPVSEFRDELSKKEYQISGMCQKCQDSIFGGSDAD